MVYLTDSDLIRDTIEQLSCAKILWIDTEIADWQTPKPRLSLIQVSANANNLKENQVYILDLLKFPDLKNYFFEKIISNSKIEKVFHNASFDLKYLGKEQAVNITCTFKIARKIKAKRLGVTNLKLKTLAKELCHFSNVDTEEQGSDWGKRPLSEKQLSYARMDVVYLAQVHQYLLNFGSKSSLLETKPIKSYPYFTVTKVRAAFDCPRLFYLAQRFGGSTLFLPANSSGIGKGFHKLCKDFIILAKTDPEFKYLFKPEISQLKKEDIALRMQQMFYDRVFSSFLDSSVKSKSLKAESLYLIWQGLINLLHHSVELLINNRRYCRFDEVIDKTFLGQEISLEQNFTLANGTKQKVKGRFDSLIYDFEHQRLCVIEYKTYETLDQSSQLAQVALYSYMLKEKLGLAVNSAVYTVLPDWQELSFSWEQLEQTIHKLIPDKLQQMQQWLDWEQDQPTPPPPTAERGLCKICPQQETCQGYFK